MPLAKTPTNALVVAGAATLLALAGCSGSTDDVQGGEEKATEPKGVVYDFTQINGMPAAKEITFQIPDRLLKSDPEYAKDRIIASVTAKAHKLDSAEYCAVDLTYAFAAGARDRVLKATWYDSAGDDEPETPAEKIFSALDGFGKPTVAKPDPSDPDFGTGSYLSEDLQTITHVVECATGPTDTDDNAEVTFTQIESLDSDQANAIGIHDFGDADVAVMKNGDLSVPEGEIGDWMLDANGDWIADD